MPRALKLSDTELDTWFERDRQHVNLKRADSGDTIIEWWDEAVTEAVEDGFLNPRDYHGTAFEYAKDMGITDGKIRAGVSIHVTDPDESEYEYDDGDEDEDEDENE